MSTSYATFAASRKSLKKLDIYSLHIYNLHYTAVKRSTARKFLLNSITILQIYIL